MCIRDRSEGPLEQFYRLLLRWLQSTISGRHCKVSVQRIDDIGVIANSAFSVAQVAKEAVTVCTSNNTLQRISCFWYAHLTVVNNGSLQCDILCVANNKGRFFAASRIVFVDQVSVGVEELGRDLEVDFFTAVLLQILSCLLGFLNVSSALVNMTQLVNTVALIGAGHTAHGMSALKNMSLSDKKILAEVGVPYNIGLDTPSGFSKRRSAIEGKRHLIAQLRSRIVPLFR